MDDSVDWYDQMRKWAITAFKAGEIDYQQFVNMNQKALTEYLKMLGKWKAQKEY
jgi:hypothetical protein